MEELIVGLLLQAVFHSQRVSMDPTSNGRMSSHH